MQAYLLKTEATEVGRVCLNNQKMYPSFVLCHMRLIKQVQQQYIMQVFFARNEPPFPRNFLLNEHILLQIVLIFIL